MIRQQPVIGIHETFVNRSKNVPYGENECFDLWTSNWKDLYKSLKAEYGPIASKMYQDTIQVNGTMHGEHIGYVFKGWARYEDTQEPYQREVWVEFITDDERV